VAFAFLVSESFTPNIRGAEESLPTDRGKRPDRGEQLRIYFYNYHFLNPKTGAKVQQLSKAAPNQKQHRFRAQI
jgi:hypothetical protein